MTLTEAPFEKTISAGTGQAYCHHNRRPDSQDDRYRIGDVRLRHRVPLVLPREGTRGSAGPLTVALAGQRPSASAAAHDRFPPSAGAELPSGVTRRRL